MKLDKNLTSNSNELLFSLSDERLEMTIDENSVAQLVNRLTDMYPRPIEATVREVMSNAIDATTKSNSKTKRGIEITLPSEGNDNFIVRDYGDGMSIETIREIYSQYGASTKTSDMNQVGAYGLGAKSPLSYCSKFMVKSTHKGITTEIVVSSENDGNYTRIVNSSPTDELSGTEVTVPVANGDSHKFLMAVNSYRTFTLDVPLFIDGEEQISSLTQVGVIPIESVGDGFGLRVFANGSMEEIVTQYIRGNTWSSRVGYFLSGWKYASGPRGVLSLEVELVPGIVDFSSSRDEITNNYRFDDLNSLCEELANAKFEEYIDKVFDENLITEVEKFKIAGDIVANSTVRYTPNRLKTCHDKILARKAASGKTYSELFTSDGNEDTMLTLHIYQSSGVLRRRVLQETINGVKYPRFQELNLTMAKRTIEDNKQMMCSIERLPIPQAFASKKYFITETTKDDLLKVNSRVNSFYRKEGERSFIITATHMSEDELRDKTDGIIDLNDCEIMTMNEFIERSKREIKTSQRKNANRKSVSSVKSDDEFNSYKLTYKKDEILISDTCIGWDRVMKDYRTTSLESDSKNILIISDKLDSQVTVDNLREVLITEINNDSQVNCYYVSKGAINRRNVDSIVSSFDSIYFNSNEKFPFRSEDVTDKIHDKSKLMNEVEIRKTTNDVEYFAKEIHHLRAFSSLVRRIESHSNAQELFGLTDTLTKAVNMDRTKALGIQYTFEEVEPNESRIQLSKIVELNKSERRQLSSMSNVSISSMTPMLSKVCELIRNKISV